MKTYHCDINLYVQYVQVHYGSQREKLRQPPLSCSLGCDH